MATKKVSPKCKNMMYEQQLKHLQVPDCDELFERAENLSPDRMAMIIHDKDMDDDGKPVEPHVHLMASFKNARHLSSVAKAFGDLPQYVQKWDERADNGFAYLIHATESARSEHKYPYDAKSVRANFDYAGLISKMSSGGNKNANVNMKVLLDQLYDGSITKDELVAQLSGSVYAAYSKKIDALWAKRLERQAIEWRKDAKALNKRITVIWIYGTAGTGKTSFARSYAYNQSQHVFISGSSRDPFSAYAGEHTIILDELRAGMIEYADLLRITDPIIGDEPVMAPARFYDKALACDLIIITSPYDPMSFYRATHMKKKDAEIDKFDQLYRRIATTICMTDDSIYQADFDRESNTYKQIEDTKRDNPYSALNRIDATMDSRRVFDSLFEKE